MAATRLRIEVWYDADDPDGDPTDVVWTDQRDMAAAELALRSGYLKLMEDRPANLFRWIAWHALRRTGQLSPSDISQGDWDKTVLAAEPEEPEGPQVPADPTSQDQ